MKASQKEILYFSKSIHWMELWAAAYLYWWDVCNRVSSLPRCLGTRDERVPLPSGFEGVSFGTAFFSKLGIRQKRCIQGDCALQVRQRFQTYHAQNLIQIAMHTSKGVWHLVELIILLGCHGWIHQMVMYTLVFHPGKLMISLNRSIKKQSTSSMAHPTYSVSPVCAWVHKSWISVAYWYSLIVEIHVH